MHGAILASIVAGQPGVVAGKTVTAGVAAAVLLVLLGLFFLWRGGIGHYLIGAIVGAITILSFSTRIPHPVTHFISTGNAIPLYIALGLVAAAALAFGFLKG